MDVEARDLQDYRLGGSTVTYHELGNRRSRANGCATVLLLVHLGIFSVAQHVSEPTNEVLEEGKQKLRLGVGTFRALASLNLDCKLVRHSLSVELAFQNGNPNLVLSHVRLCSDFSRCV